MERLFASPALSRITTLHAQNNHGVEFGSAIAETIAANAQMTRLTTIDLSGHWAGNEGFWELFSAPQYTLENVVLAHSNLDDGIPDVLGTIFEDRMNRLQHLNVSCNLLSSWTIIRLLEYFQGRSLRVLNAAYNATTTSEEGAIRWEARRSKIEVSLGRVVGNGSFARRTGTLRLEG
jgi:hypothetical protein